MFAVFGALNCGNRKTSADERWEYVTFAPPDIVYDQTLNRLGAEGWELVAVRRVRVAETGDMANEATFRRRWREGARPTTATEQLAIATEAAQEPLRRQRDAEIADIDRQIEEYKQKQREREAAQTTTVTQTAAPTSAPATSPSPTTTQRSTPRPATDRVVYRLVPEPELRRLPAPLVVEQDDRLARMQRTAETQGLVFLDAAHAVYHEPTCRSISVAMDLVRQSVAQNEGNRPAADCHEER
jgi:hypothetical protein